MLARYLKLLGLQFKTSALLMAQYRLDFVLDAVTSSFWTATALIPLLVVYGTQHAAGIPGWSFPQALVVTGFFILLQGILEGAINPGLAAVVDHIRKGTLDFVLMKPVDSQFLVSTARFQLWRVASFITSGFVFAVAFHRMNTWPDPRGVFFAMVLLAAAVLVLYSIWILVISTAFYVVKVDNLTYLFSSIFDVARWPAAVFSGILKWVFTYIIPVALMTTYPAEALLGRLEIKTLFVSILGALAFAAVARIVWIKSISKYTSASS